jgi:hypothetical protein
MKNNILNCDEESHFIINTKLRNDSKLQVINQPRLPQLRRTQHHQRVAALAAHGEAYLWGLQVGAAADG